VRVFFLFDFSRVYRYRIEFLSDVWAVGCTVALMVGGRGPDLRSSPCPSRLLRAFTATTTTLRPRPSVGPSVTFWVVVSTGNFFFKRVFFSFNIFPGRQPPALVFYTFLLVRCAFALRVPRTDRRA